MQPIQIRMNAAVVLIVLLLAVPLQLFLSHYIQQAYLEASSLEGQTMTDKTTVDREGEIVVSDRSSHRDVQDDIDKMRAEAMDRLGVSLKHIVENVQETFHYYSKWEHFKELFIIPYKKPQLEEEGEMLHVSRNENGELIITTRKVRSPKKSKAKDKPKSKNVSIKSKQSTRKASSSSSSSKTTGTSKTDSTTTKESKSAQSQTKTKLKEVYEPSTSTAKEVDEYLMKEVYFSRSKTPRSPKPRNIQFSVGQVVKHIGDNFYGVIVGWDEVAKAPDSWLKRHYFNRKYVETTPHYLVLLDTHFDASGVPFHYIPQEDLELVQDNVQVRAPELKEYFEGFRNHRHIPRPWLKERYPED